MLEDLTKLGKRLNLTGVAAAQIFAKLLAALDRADYSGAAGMDWRQGKYRLDLRITKEVK